MKNTLISPKIRWVLLLHCLHYAYRVFFLSMQFNYGILTQMFFLCYKLRIDKFVFTLQKLQTN